MTPYYQDLSSRLYHGDAAEILPGLGVQPQLILTSPPYDNLRDYGGHGFDFDRIADALVSIMPPGGVLVWVVADQIVNGGESGSSFRQTLAFMDRGLKLHQTMYYQKASEMPITNNRYANPLQYMFVFSNGKPTTFNALTDKLNVTRGRVFHAFANMGRQNDMPKHTDGKGRIIPKYGKRINVWRYAVGQYKSAPDFLPAHEHPAIFPLALAKDHIKTWTNPNDLVLDPMAGSGTTLRAAKDLGRLSVGVEIHQPYCDLIIRRLAQQVLPMEDV